MKSPPFIKPLSNETLRPRWSVMIPVYNCAHLLPQALASILEQDPGPEHMQIEVVDDASTDADVAAIVQSVGKGRVQYFRQPENVGSLRNFEVCINRARGYLVHLLHGDDRVRNGYYKKIETLFDQYPQAGAAFCHYDYIDEEGRIMWDHPPSIREEGLLDGWLLQIARRQILQYCAITVKREVYENLGGYYGVVYGEDWEMWVRIASKYEVAYTPEVLAEYRKHASSISSRSFMNAQNIHDIKWVIDAIQHLIPEKERPEVKKTAYRHYARYALTIANSLWHQTHDKEVTKLQIREAMAMHSDLHMWFMAAKIYTKMFINRV